jgi:para-nitrobenzyl esterase
MMKKLAVYLLAFSALLAGLQLGAWLTRPDQMAVDPTSERSIAQGRLVGFVDQENTHAWLGIPYAKAPVGELRWRAPRPAEAWQGLFKALNFARYCTQIANPSVSLNMIEWGKASGSEDCLYLNIWAPAFSTGEIPRNDERLPVMLWLHGGGNSVGHSRTYPGAVLAGSQRVIVVTINYRLGVFGWLSHRALRTTAANAVDGSGNYGTLDMIQALTWVRDNIAAFGGNPNNITVFGESAGGGNVVSLLASPLARGLFHRAIVQSGAVNSSPRSRAENTVDATEPGHVASSAELLLGLVIADDKAADRESAKRWVASMSDQQLLVYLQSKTSKQLLNFFHVLDYGMYRLPQLIEDGVVLPATSMLEVFKHADRYNAVPLITGTNRDEAKLFLMNDARMVDTSLGVIKTITDPQRYELFNHYRSDAWRALAVDQLANDIAQAQKVPVWTYRFDWDEAGDTLWADYSVLMGAAHALEIPFLFRIYRGLTMPGVFTDSNKQSREQLSSQMMSFWAEFAYKGAPGQGRNQQLPHWQAWNLKAGNTLLFDSDADGGVRMASVRINVEQLKSELANDAKIQNNRDRCELYVQMFYERPAFQWQEYQQLPGCAKLPVSDFKPW